MQFYNLSGFGFRKRRWGYYKFCLLSDIYEIALEDGRQCVLSVSPVVIQLDCSLILFWPIWATVFDGDGFSLYLTDRLRSMRYEFNQNIVISSQHRAIVLIQNKISWDWAIIYWLFYLNVNRLIFDLLIFTIFSSTHPPKTNTGLSNQHSIQSVLTILN